MEISLFKWLLFLYQMISISSYYPTLIEGPVPTETTKSYDSTNRCSCDLTMNVCNYGCLCDPDCIVYPYITFLIELRCYNI